MSQGKLVRRSRRLKFSNESRAFYRAVNKAQKTLNQGPPSVITEAPAEEDLIETPTITTPETPTHTKLKKKTIKAAGPDEISQN
ncbi:hypothetical protein CEXT_788081 [Caerostris extrusa]|uniref:Uncharacterized protein n=1 Tax=Caerostris extrusa TaxID=172846 RepID=A0AAV4RH70_CAEEX|nr:hypothetical protein CEXT_788081 [Caerostris extrusa]